MNAIAIDGPSGAGKTMLSNRLAAELGYIHIDTGALYRAVGLHVLKTVGSCADAAKTVAALSGCDIKLSVENGVQTIRLNGRKIGDEIRTPQIGAAASAVSALPEVRAFLLDLQRNIAQTSDVIMDGRDIGTVILPDAQVKIFLTASPGARARRRYLQLREAGIDADPDTVLKQIIKRDSSDSGREHCPLRPADDAVILDTTHLDYEQSYAALLKLVKNGLEGKKEK